MSISAKLHTQCTPCETALSKSGAENQKTPSKHDQVIVKTTTKTNHPTTLNKPTKETMLSNLRLVPHLTAMVASI